MKETIRHLLRGAGTIFDIFPQPRPQLTPREQMELIWKQTGDLLYDAIGQFAEENGLPSPEEIQTGKPAEPTGEDARSERTPPDRAV